MLIAVVTDKWAQSAEKTLWSRKTNERLRMQVTLGLQSPKEENCFIKINKFVSRNTVKKLVSLLYNSSKLNRRGSALLHQSEGAKKEREENIKTFVDQFRSKY